jgi:xanthine dehydrogenase YagS FAD-binding subunit
VASAAVALELDGDHVRTARIALGGVAYRPWRSHEAEAELDGCVLDEQSAEAAARAAFAQARPSGENSYKIELGRRTLVRALLQAKELS